MAEKKKAAPKKANGDANGGKKKENGNTGFMSKLADEQKHVFESRVKEVGIDMNTFQELLEYVGEYGPVLYTAILRLLEIFGADAVQKKAVFGHHECPEELRKALCENEMAALDALACAIMARHIACCDHDEMTFESHESAV